MHGTTHTVKADEALVKYMSITERKAITAVVLVLAATLRNPLSAVTLLTIASLQHMNWAVNGNHLQGNIVLISVTD